VDRVQLTREMVGRVFLSFQVHVVLAALRMSKTSLQLLHLIILSSIISSRQGADMLPPLVVVHATHPSEQLQAQRTLPRPDPPTPHQPAPTLLYHRPNTVPPNSKSIIIHPPTLQVLSHSSYLLRVNPRPIRPCQPHPPHKLFDPLTPLDYAQE